MRQISTESVLGLGTRGGNGYVTLNERCDRTGAMAIDSKRKVLYVTDGILSQVAGGRGRIAHIRRVHTVTGKVTPLKRGQTQKRATSMAVDVSTGMLYVMFRGNYNINGQTIFRYRPDGTLDPKFAVGTLNKIGFVNSPDKVKFNRPNGLVVDDTAGILYVMDTLNHLIRRVDLSTATAKDSATVSTLVGTGKAGHVNGPINLRKVMFSSLGRCSLDTKRKRLFVFNGNGWRIVELKGCASCLAGTFSSKSADACTPCKAGRFIPPDIMSRPSAMSCLPCPPHSSSTNGSTSCSSKPGACAFLGPDCV